MTTRVGINGFGRIGRAFTRMALDRADLDVVAVNDITDARTLAHLLEFDSTYGRLVRPVQHTQHSLTVGDSVIAVTSERDPATIDWARLGADIVVRVDRQVPHPGGRGRPPQGRGAEGADLCPRQGRRPDRGAGRQL
jgi:hypothetical protein